MIEQWVNKYIKIDKSPMQKTLNNLCRYFTLREMEHNPPMLKCGLLLEIAFQRAQNGKSEKKSNFMVRETCQIWSQAGDLGQRQIVWTFLRMWWEGHFTWGNLPPPNLLSQDTHEKTREKSKSELRDSVGNSRAVLLQTVVKNKENENLSHLSTV